MYKELIDLFKLVGIHEEIDCDLCKHENFVGETLDEVDCLNYPDKCFKYYPYKLTERKIFKLELLIIKEIGYIFKDSKSYATDQRGYTGDSVGIIVCNMVQDLINRDKLNKEDVKNILCDEV